MARTGLEEGFRQDKEKFNTANSNNGLSFNLCLFRPYRLQFLGGVNYDMFLFPRGSGFFGLHHVFNFQIPGSGHLP